MSENFDVSKFEPVAEKVMLPSRGVFYKDHNKPIFDDKGNVLVRPMTLREETLIKSPRIIKSGQFINVLLRECIKTPGIDVLKMISADRMFLFFYLRTISYGDDYGFSTKCPHCEISNIYHVNLRSLEIIYSKDTDKEPFEISLRGTKVLMRLSRGIDEEANASKSTDTISNADQEDKKQEEFDVINSLVNVTIDIQGVPREYWRKFYETLSPVDSDILNRAVDASEPGMKDIVSVKCLNPECGKSFINKIPITANFFRVSGK